jgi:hypothetical protein
MRAASHASATAQPPPGRDPDQYDVIQQARESGRIHGTSSKALAYCGFDGFRIDRGEQDGSPAASRPDFERSSATTPSCGWSVTYSNEPSPSGSRRHRRREPLPLRRRPEGRPVPGRSGLPGPGDPVTPISLVASPNFARPCAPREYDAACRSTNAVSSLSRWSRGSRNASARQLPPHRCSGLDQAFRASVSRKSGGRSPCELQAV